MKKLLILLLLTWPTARLKPASSFLFYNSFISGQTKPFTIVGQHCAGVTQKPVADPALRLTQDELLAFASQTCLNPSIDLREARHFVWTSQACRGIKLFATNGNCTRSQILLKLPEDQYGQPQWVSVAQIQVTHAQTANPNIRGFQLARQGVQTYPSWSVLINHALNYTTLCHNPIIDGPLIFINYLSSRGITFTFKNGRKVELNLHQVDEQDGEPVYQWTCETFCQKITNTASGYQELVVQTARILSELQPSLEATLSTLSIQDFNTFTDQPQPYIRIGHVNQSNPATKIAIADDYGKIYILSHDRHTNRWILESTMALDTVNQIIVLTIYLKAHPAYFYCGYNWNPLSPHGISFDVPNSGPEKTIRFQQTGKQTNPKEVRMTLLPSGTLCNRA